MARNFSRSHHFKTLGYYNLFQLFFLVYFFFKLLNFSRRGHSNKLSIDIFDTATSYITATVGEKYGKIVQYSPNCPELFQYTKNEFDFLDTVSAIIPTTIAGQTHDDIIKCFMSTGKETVTNQLRELFARNKNNFIFKI